jgi:hypothetical protein
LRLRWPITWARPSSSTRRWTALLSSRSALVGKRRSSRSLLLLEAEKVLGRRVPGRDALLHVQGDDRDRAEFEQLLVVGLLSTELGLAVAERLLGHLSLGDVEQEPLEDQRLSPLVPHNQALVTDPDDASVGRDQPVLGAQRASSRPRARVVLKHALTVIRMEHPHEEVRFGLPALRRVAEHPLDVRARVDVRADLVEAVDIDGERQLLHQLAIPPLSFAERLLERLALRNVDEVAVAVSRLVLPVRDGTRLIQEPANLSVARDHPVLGAERLARLLRPALLRKHPVVIVGMDDLAEEIRVGCPLRGRVAKDRLQLRAHVEVGARLVRPVDVDRQRALLDKGLQPPTHELPLDLPLVLSCEPVGPGHHTLPRRSQSA